jgi:dipeptidyl aminopeptidase/acylaminoacyl peptidase
MAACGRSYGGFMVNWINGHTDRFACLIAIDGTSNSVSFYGTTDELWFPQWDIGGTPWDNPDEYRRTSPITYAAEFKTPQMVIHSELDNRVDIGEGLQMFTTLQRRGVPSQLLVFPNEGHSVHRLENLREAYEQQLGWLARWLNPAN